MTKWDENSMCTSQLILFFVSLNTFILPSSFTSGFLGATNRARLVRTLNEILPRPMFFVQSAIHCRFLPDQAYMNYEPFNIIKS